MMKSYALIIAACLLFSTQSWAATDFTTTLRLQRQLAHKAEVPVIVTFNNGLNRPFSADLARSFSAKRNKLMQALSNTSYKNRKDFTYTGQISLTVDQAALSVLLSDSTISVSENKLHKPFLAESVNRVYPTQNSSPYHGNNQWTVAVLDSGIDKNHSFLSGVVVSEACYSDGGGEPGTTSLCPGGATSSTATNSGLPCPSSIAGCDHGTLAAGIVAGDGGSFDGVARDSKLISIQVFSRVNDIDFCAPYARCLGSYTSDIIAALNRVYALRNTYNIAAVNLSLGQGLYTGSCDSDPQKPAIDLLRNAGIATIVASGNDGSANQMASPACISSAIAVGSTSEASEAVSSFSNSSTLLDLYAPGQGITSSVPGGGYSTVGGTSFAAPHVAGAWAVVKHASPSATVNVIENAFKANGPLASKSGVSRRRINISAVIANFTGGGGNSKKNEVNVAPILLLLLDD